MPRPPENVRLRMKDGSVVPIQFVYAGWDPEQRLYLWRAVEGTPIVEAGMHLLCDALPARSSLILPLADGANVGRIERD